MRTKFSKRNLYTFCGILLTTFVIISFTSCGDDLGLQAKGDYISGYAIFVDTNYIHGNGYYAIALYDCRNSLYSSNPLQTNKIEMENKLNPYYYRITWGGEWSCFAAIVWISNDSLQGQLPLILGTYGCDTSHNCGTHTPIAFPNFSGANFNIQCWADTSKKLY